eukprot:5469718-Lingulodinium_polyedra.AAC.1
MRNPEERCFSDCFKGVEGAELIERKRCGQIVCKFVAATFDVGKSFRSAELHDAGLWHVLRRE